ncbi:hypothetical protein BS78_K128100 [Paspalum vaginatum]|uniref:AIPP2-like SPOC-like domain-containing protein n=1 Tax=Paspalum vaginatum TaxID=158149 RepID=A0A9W7X6H4_9POAL|nr:hypothetical protein BS78_K128100 [Paspalum vaginatum]
MREPQERTMRDLYDRTRHRDLAPAEEPAGGRGGGRAEGSGHRELVAKMEDKTSARKRIVSGKNIRPKAESGTCNVCYAPCSSCLHRGLAVEDSNVECTSSQTCSMMSEVKNNSLVRNEKGLCNKDRNEKGLCNKEENDDEFSATSGHVSYSVTGGNKVVARSPIADDLSEVGMPSKRRRLLNQDTRVSRAEHHDDSNSCVTGTSAEGKLHVDRKKLSTSASSRDLTAKDYKEKSMANHSRLRNQCADESKKGSDACDMNPSSSGRLFPACSPSVMTKKLLRTQSSVSTSSRLSPNSQAHDFGREQDDLSHQPSEKDSPSKNSLEQPRGEKLNPCVGGGDKHGSIASHSNRNANKVGFSSKDPENGTSCSKNEIQEHADIHYNDGDKRNEGDRQDWDQDCSMDMSSDEKLNIQHDATTDCGNSEGLIDVNVCDICGDVGREYLLATCTRCLEGAEHTYCMRVKLDKVPDGEWLCEECQLKENQNNTRSNYGVPAVNMLEGKNQSSESQSKRKALQIVVPDLDAPQVTCSTPTADQCDGKNKRLHLASADSQTRQVKAITPAAERLDVKNKKLSSTANHNKLQVLTSDLETRPHNYGTLASGGSNKKNQSSEFLLNHKKLRVSTDMESPLSSEGLRSPPISCKRQSENTSSPKPRLFKTDSLRKQDVTRENSVKKSNNGGLPKVDNVPERTTQVVKSSLTLSRSYSSGNMMNAKSSAPSPRGLLSKQQSFNSTNIGPKVKQLADGMASKLAPAKHSPRDTRDKGSTRKLIHSRSFKHEGSISIDAGSSKQKQTFHLPRDEKPGISKPMKENNLIERRASFGFKKPNIPSSPRPDSCMKSGERKIDQDISRSGPSILKSSKRPGNVEKKQSSDLSKSDNEKQDVTVHPKPMGVVSGKDAHAVRISDPLGNVEKKQNSDLSKIDNEKQDVTVHPKPMGVVSSKDAHAVRISDAVGNVEKKQNSDLSKIDNEKQDVTVHPKPMGVVSSKDAHAVRISDAVGNVEKKQNSDLSKSDNEKQDVTVHPRAVSGKDTHALRISDPPVKSQFVKRDSSNAVEDEDLSVSMKNGNRMPNEPAEAIPTTFSAVTCESDLRDVPRAITSEDSAPEVICCQQKLLESTGNDSCNVEVAQASEDTLPGIPHGLQVAHNPDTPANKLDEPNLKKEVCVDQSSALENPLRDLVIPEQSYIWQGSFEVSRHGNCPQMFDGFQAYLSTCASSKVREVGEQLPGKIQLAEVPRHSSWPLQFKEVNPSEDNIAIFFFAKDVESYERAYGKLLDNMLLGDLSLTANIGGTELLIFPSDKLPERIQRWNGLLFFWGIFYGQKASSPLELPVTRTNNCQEITGMVIQHDMGFPNVPQSLGIDLNECPNDDISDPAISLGSESEKPSASVDHNILLDSKHDDIKLNLSEIRHEETAGTRQIIPGYPTAALNGTSTGEANDMIWDYPTAAKGSTGTAGRNKTEEEDQNEALFCLAQEPAAVRSISDEIKPKKPRLLPSVEVLQCYFSGSKACDGPSKSIPNADMGSLDADLTYKGQKCYYGKHSTYSFGHELTSKCSSKMHPLPAGQHNPLDDLQYRYKGPSDPGSLKKHGPDHIIHVLSSDDEDSPEPSTSLNKASLKADEGSSLLSLSLSMVATKHNISGSDIVDDEPLSLSLGLPSVVKGSKDPEIQQFLPEKPGINT